MTYMKLEKSDLLMMNNLTKNTSTSTLFTSLVNGTCIPPGPCIRPHPDPSFN